MRARRTDSNHKAVLDAIRALGYPCMSLHAHGKGLEDILVGMRTEGVSIEGDVGSWQWWLLVEVKVPRNKRREVTPSQFTDQQKEWREQTEGFPRLVVTSAQDAVDQIRRLTG